MSRGIVVLWAALVLALLAVGALAARTFAQHGVPVTVAVDGYTEQVRTSRPDVASLLADVGLGLGHADRVQPAPATPLTPGLQIEVQRARHGLIISDGTTREIDTRASTVGGLLADAQVPVGINDEIYLEGQKRVALDAPLPRGASSAGPPRFARRHAWSGHEAPPVHIVLHRAVPITVDDGSLPYTIYTTAPTVGEALLGEKLTLYLGDHVQPSLGSPVHSGMRVLIQRSRAVLLTADGRTVQTRTRGRTVGDALSELGVTVAGSDRLSPPMAEPIRDNLPISITRVLETVKVEREEIPFASILIADDNLELDQQQLQNQGGPGEFRRRSRLIYEDGRLKSQTLLDAWTASEPITRVLAFGRKIVPRTVETSEGPLSYWRKIRMRATAYSKSTAGVSPSSPYYGITRSGLPMRKGIVAVDPTVIPLGTRVYVPGYGVGLAADTGGGVRSRLIDLGYDDDNLESWYRWVDVYLLDPPSPPGRIRWVLPKWPLE